MSDNPAHDRASDIARELYDACNAFKEDDAQWQRMAVAIQAADGEIKRLRAALENAGQGSDRPCDSPSGTGSSRGEAVSCMENSWLREAWLTVKCGLQWPFTWRHASSCPLRHRNFPPAERKS